MVTPRTCKYQHDPKMSIILVSRLKDKILSRRLDQFFSCDCFHPQPSRNSPHFTPNFGNFSPSSNELIQQLNQHQRSHQYPKLPTNQTIAMAPKGKKVERKEENISLGPQIREGQRTISFPMKFSP